MWPVAGQCARRCRRTHHPKSRCGPGAGRFRSRSVPTTRKAHRGRLGLNPDAPPDKSVIIAPPHISTSSTHTTTNDENVHRVPDPNGTPTIDTHTPVYARSMKGGEGTDTCWGALQP